MKVQARHMRRPVAGCEAGKLVPAPSPSRPAPYWVQITTVEVMSVWSCNASSGNCVGSFCAMLSGAVVGILTRSH